ncbi:MULTISPECIES: hypothetical protein [Priestia]|uniref:Uncharacterized protein n=1 Tax=Priestia aryabhattai TaxID=412384 RepID=A0ABD5KVG6_PRIAR|nr:MULTISPECIES: hypothetical protein [Priestia]UPK51130.1 hypothetical protein MT476_05915 [Bacillus sp. H8-1]MBY0209702.1 hypothetical protein [Priestia aryabhattai]MCA1051460.1 hypothetical protein [Priestia aryabhattai]MDC7765929.1 hypothetical protein [Priestia aryabhattai]MEB4885378.1 hypothetical protein [Priestia megaterium]
MKTDYGAVHAETYPAQRQGAVGVLRMIFVREMQKQMKSFANLLFSVFINKIDFYIKSN